MTPAEAIAVCQQLVADCDRFYEQIVEPLEAKEAWQQRGEALRCLLAIAALKPTACGVLGHPAPLPYVR